MTYTMEKKPFSPSLVVCMIVILVASLIVKPSPYRPLFCIPLIGIGYYLLYHTTSGDVISDLSFGFGITSLVAAALDYIVLTEPQTQLFKRGQKMPSSSFPSLWERVKWALDLLTSQRGIGWTHEPTEKLPPSPFASGNVSRQNFITYQLVAIAGYFLLFDMCSIHLGSRPSFSIAGPPLSSEPFLWKCINASAWAMSVFAGLSISHSLVSIAFVGLGIWSDLSQWKPFFGSWKDAYTVRRLWSLTWHQYFRRVLTIPGQKLRSSLSISKGTIASCIILYTSFFISAWIHHPADYMVIGHYGGAVKFFMAQALVITVEDGVLGLGKSYGFADRKLWRILGYLWVQTWFAFLVPIWIQPQVTGGLFENGIGFSVILGLWEGRWRPA